MNRRDLRLAQTRSRQQRKDPLLLTGLMRRWAAAILPILCSACLGGSGSSGFDATPAAENGVIERAVLEGQCQPVEELTICPANAEALVIPGSDVPIVQGTQVVSEVSAPEIARCAQAGERFCSVAMRVSGAGLPAGAYQLAGRGQESRSRWRISEPAVIFRAGEEVMFAGRVEIPADSTSFQVAVLVFLEGVGTAVGEIRTLAETRADLAFVTAPSPMPR